MSLSVAFCKGFPQTFAISRTDAVVDATEGFVGLGTIEPGVFATTCAETLSNVLNIKKRVKK